MIHQRHAGRETELRTADGDGSFVWVDEAEERHCERALTTACATDDADLLASLRSGN